MFTLFLRALPVSCLLLAHAVAQPVANQARQLQELKAAVEQEPQNPLTRYQLAEAYHKAGELDLAKQEYTRAIELHPGWIAPRLALAQLQVTTQDYDGALKTTAGVVELAPGNLNARLIECAALAGQKKYGDARRILAELRESNSDSPDVWFQTGVVELAVNHFTEAESAFRRGYELNPANQRGLLGIVETYMAQNKSAEALRLLQAEVDKAPARQDLLISLGNIAVRTGKYDLAIASFRKALELSPDSSGDLWLRLGETYRRKGDPEGAIDALEKAREATPDSVVVLSTLALVLDAGGHKSEALAMYQATLKLQPNNVVALNNMAFLMSQTGGDLDEALKMALRAQQLFPNLSEISDTLGCIYLKRKETSLAIDTLSALVARQSQHAIYRYHLGMAYAQKGDKAKALEQLEEALKNLPPREDRDKITALMADLKK